MHKGGRNIIENIVISTQPQRPNNCNRSHPNKMLKPNIHTIEPVAK
jgi:hypothetical protein